MYKYTLFLEWIRTRHGELAFLLNSICPICHQDSPVLIKSQTTDLFYCGKCWIIWVGFDESIEMKYEIRRYHRKCGCISLYTYNPDNFVKSDIFDIQLCELHKSQIIDEYEA